MDPSERPTDTGSGFVCPIPIEQYPMVLLAHGGGGKLTHQLIERMFLPSFRNPALEARHDGAVIETDGARVAFTTDSYVVRPLFFPGGDIGSLAVFGTVNDLAMCGARPIHLSAGFILEEGLPMETLWKVVESMRGAAAEDEHLDRHGGHEGRRSRQGRWSCTSTPPGSASCRAGARSVPTGSDPGTR